MTRGTTTPTEEEMPPDLTDGGSEGELLEIALGPHHPSTHGVFRMDVVLDGERVVKLKPVFGYLHRNHEKIAETASYLSSMPYTDRLDYMCSLTQQLGLRAQRRKTCRPAGSRTRRIHPRDHRRADAPAKSRLHHWISDAGDGRERHAADVRLSRAGKDT